MASIQQRAPKAFLIQFYDRNGKKRGISISNITKKMAENIKVHVENLNAAARSGHVPPDVTSTWLAGIGDVLASKLAKVGLIEHRSVKTLGVFIEELFKERKDWKPRTLIKHETTKNHLLGFFKASKPLREFTEADADAFARHIKNDVPTMKSSATKSKALNNVRGYFRAAVRKRLIPSNPFDHISIPQTGGNRFHFVKQEDAKIVLDACPNPQWRMIFALARYGGLRIPSELQGLEWKHILWDQNKILVHSPKTEHHENKDKRLVPIYPELRPYLDEGLQYAKEGDRYVITIHRKNGELSAAFIRRRMLDIIEKAGVIPWPKIFQNCRSTRQTELENQFASHKVCAWMGNTEKVARKHYLQVTDDDFQEAAGEKPRTEEEERSASEKYQQILKLMTQFRMSGSSMECQEVPSGQPSNSNDSSWNGMKLNGTSLNELRNLLEGLEPPIDSL